MTNLKSWLLSTAGIAICAAALSILPESGQAQALIQGPSGLAGGEPSPAAEAAETPPLSGNAIFIDKHAPAAERSAATSALRSKASAQGLVRVIVGLGVNVQAPHELSEAESAGQERALRTIQTSVVNRVLGTAASDASVANFDNIPFLAMNVTAAQLDRLVTDPDVVNIQEDVPVPPTLAQSVPFINADTLANAGFLGSGFAVAVLDTGVDKTHAMFPGNKIASEACFSTTVAGQSKSVCPPGSNTAPGSGVNCPINGCSHGTHVAGIAAGNMGSPQLRGVARGARIIAVQVFSRFDSPANCGGTAPCALSYGSDQIKGLQRVYALRNKLNIASVNMSLGGGQFAGPCDKQNAGLKAAIDRLRAVRIATVIASGNSGFNGTMGAPACISSAIAVGSTLDTSNNVSSFSNHAGNVRLMAPGSDIKSSVPPGPRTTDIFDGTSMAAPHVAGAFAQLRDVKAQSTVDDIAAALECTGVPVTRAGITEPRINMTAARAYLVNPPKRTRNFNFNVAAQANKWTPFVGLWDISNGSYHPAAIGGWALSTIDNCNENVTITSRFKRIWPAGQAANAGIAFKAQLSSGNRTMHGYFASINRDVPGNNHKGNVVLWRLDGYNLQNDSGKATVLCNTDLDSIASNTFINMKVVSQGGVHKVIINNRLRCSATDRTYGTGRTGPMTINPPNAFGHQFLVDSFAVDPTEKVPANDPAADEVALAE